MSSVNTIQPLQSSTDHARTVPPRGHLPLSTTDPLPRGWQLVLAATLALAFGNVLFSAWDQGWTYDEPFHLGWAERFWDTGLGERQSQQRFNSKTPIMLPGVLIRKAAAAAGVRDETALRFAARAPGAAWLALLLATTFAVARRAFGSRAGALATGAAALDPNLVAHSSVATSDVPYAAATLLTLAAGLALFERPSARRGAVLGLALGLAFVAKVTAVLLLPGLAVLPFVVRGERRRGRALVPLLLGLLLAALLALAVVDGAYLFRGLGHPLSAIAPRSPLLAAVTRVMPGLRLPVPEAFLTAFDASLMAERGEWNTVILGRRYEGGVWYYFAFLWLVKTPLLVLFATALGLVRVARDAGARRSPLAALLGWNLLLILGYFSLVFRAHIGYRYVLMAVPLAYVLAGAGLVSLRPSRLAPYALAAATCAAMENAMYLGNPLAFTNGAVWPKTAAYRLIADSNIDWGQNRERIGRWLALHHLTYTHLEPVHLLPGHDTFDLNALAGVWDFDQHAWVREHLRPVGHLGHTYLLYEVDEGTWQEYLEQSRRRAPDALSASLCPDELSYVHEPIGSKVPFTLDRNPEPGELWAECVIAPQGADVGLVMRTGSLAAGRFVSPGVCDTLLVLQGQEAWWRLDPGTHALCVVPQPNRRAWLPFHVEARWMLRGRGVRLNARPLPPVSTPPSPAATTPRSSSPPLPPEG